jgi:hypothetical protein
VDPYTNQHEVDGQVCKQRKFDGEYCNQDRLDVGTDQISNIAIVETGKINSHSTQIHDH